MAQMDFTFLTAAQPLCCGVKILATHCLIFIIVGYAFVPY